MPVRHVLSLSVLAVAGAVACASTPAASGVEEPPPRRYPFIKRPAKPRGCAFEVFEARAPERAYEVLGTLPMSTNMWLGARGREALLADTACRAGADAVLLPPPLERTVGDLEVREYSAVFIAYTDVPGAADAGEAPPVAPSDGDTVFVPIGEELLGDTEGTLTRPLGPEDDAYWR